MIRSFAQIADAAAEARESIVDDGDRAQRSAEAFAEAALASRYDPPADPQKRLPDGTVICVDCDEPIPPARLKAHENAVRCIDCQRDAERLGG
jgi:phage/conjugal plasmid C-4 type zinc finger TraR family protein